MMTIAMERAPTRLAMIKNTLRERVASGVIGHRSKLPSERELSELFNTTRITIKDALISLETEGLIYREERKGWYVSPPRVRYNPLSRSHFEKMVTEQHRQARTVLLQVKTEIANGEQAKALGIDSICPIHIIERLRYIDDRAVLFVENCLKVDLFPEILKYGLTTSLTRLFTEQYGYHTHRSRFEVIPTSAPKHVAKSLGLVEGQPILKICRINYKQDGELMDCEFEYWRPDAVMISIDSEG
ncbi:MULTISPECIES: UTRA domain-containing protein [Vibrio]|uniref:UTRA domain-containing protein n=1 Tax=Vibrio TaxID=662 RepID=UPI001574CCAE|nr:MULTISPECIES: UTRA domain-containing protein [Vibrio]